MLDVRGEVIVTSSLSHCLQHCLMMAEECNSAMFLRDQDECIINKKSQFSDPDLFHPTKRVDYFDNVCEYEVRPAKTPPGSAQQNDGESATHSTKTKIRPMFKPDVHQIKKHQNDVKNKAGLLDTDCRLDGISISAHFDVISSGAVFIKDHSPTCRQGTDSDQ